MTGDQISKALHILRPEAQWALTGNNYSTILWFSDDSTAPTLDEIVAEINTQS